VFEEVEAIAKIAGFSQSVESLGSESYQPSAEHTTNLNIELQMDYNMGQMLDRCN
jgi:hypothetical protein